VDLERREAMTRPPSVLVPALLALALAVSAAVACGPDDPAPAPAPTLTGQALLDPHNCAPCHARHVREWSGSMHAYAADDPVFVAMNARMQRETGGQSKDFCVGCHAPMAVRTGATTDGMNLAQLPQHLRGVTCVFCHEASSVEGTHDNPLKLAGDGVLRGAFADPAKSSPHRAARSPLHDREDPSSSQLCGACHDVITPHGAHIERTFAEWKDSLYAKTDAKPTSKVGSGLGQLSCGKCHMTGRTDVAADSEGVPVRTVHDHAMPAVDVAVTPWPEAADQRRRVQEFLDGSLIAKLCVLQTPAGPTADITLDNAFAGHGFPSGASHDRRAWVEVVAFRGGQVVFQSGVVPDRKAVEAVQAAEDPNMWLLRDKLFDTSGGETHLFWQAARVEPSQLPAAVTNDPLDPRFYHQVKRSYALPFPPPDRLTMRVRMRPMDFALLDDLVASGDLAPDVLDRMPTFDLASTVKEWTKDAGFGCVP
jgi:hypothetical protein